MLPDGGITVVTCTIPERAELLERNKASVPSHIPHLVNGDPGDYGECYNALIEQVSTPWVAFLDDDNYWHPNHLETISPHLTGDHDVVYTWDSSGTRPRVNVNDWSQDYIVKLGEDFNWLDQACAVRVEKLREVGGLAGAEKPPPKDWDLWQRMAKADARFFCVPVATWFYQQYRLDGLVARELPDDRRGDPSVERAIHREFRRSGW